MQTQNDINECKVMLTADELRFVQAMLKTHLSMLHVSGPNAESKEEYQMVATIADKVTHLSKALLTHFGY